MDKYELLTNKLDCLREAGNIGAGNAATALSILLRRPVDMSVARINIKDISELSNVLGDDESDIAAMLIEVYGDIKAMLILSFEITSARKLIDMVLEGMVGPKDTFDEMDYSVLCETGNILAGTYVNALSRLTGLTMDLSVPQIAIDMAAAILNYPAIEYATEDSAVMFIETCFTDFDRLVNGTYILVLDDKSFKAIAGALESLI